MTTDAKKITKKESRDRFVIDFVQFVAAPQPHPKRLRRLRKTFANLPANLTHAQWLRLWRGFYYCVWYTEMRKGGEEMIEEMGAVQDLSYLLSGVDAISDSWQGIDAFRIDKYMFLMRHIFRNIITQQCAALLEDQKQLFESNCIWRNFVNQRRLLVKGGGGGGDEDQKEGLSNKLESLSYKAKGVDFMVSRTSEKSIGLFLHLCDIFLEEVNKVVEGRDHQTRTQLYVQMLSPFARPLGKLTDDRLRAAIINKVFNQLKDQVLVSEDIDLRRNVLEQLLEPLKAVAVLTEHGGRRREIYNLLESFEAKLEALKAEGERVLAKPKRRLVGMDRNKRPRYEVYTDIPFVKSVVPLPTY